MRCTIDEKLKQIGNGRIKGGRTKTFGILEPTSIDKINEELFLAKGAAL